MPYLTPDTAPDNEWVVRRVQLPANIKWTSIFDGMMLDLCYARNWELDGALTPTEMADWFWQHYAEFTADFKETPNSDTPDDLDGTPAYPWYEKLCDWIIAGFLAITFTRQAAITYNATVPKLRVAFRTGNIGALFKVLINGIEVWSGDSYAPITGVIDRVFDNTNLAKPYNVQIVHNGSGEHITLGTAKLEYIREGALADMVATILRADPTGCGIQWSQDDGGTWSTIDLATCITDLANGAIGQAIDDGKLAVPGGQPGPSAPPSAGQCKTYHVVLSARDVWRCPSEVNSGDSVSISNANGGWYDGVALEPWRCPTGGAYVLGSCGSTPSYNTGDPINTLPHMMVIGHVVNTYFDPTTAYVVPAGTVNQPFYIQANDDVLTDNQGSIEFDVQICSYLAAANLTSVYTYYITNLATLSKTIVHPGDTFTFTLAWQAPQNRWDGRWESDIQATFKIIDVQSCVNGGGWQWVNPDEGYGGQCPALDAQKSCHGYAGNAQQQTVITFQVVSIP